MTATQPEAEVVGRRAAVVLNPVSANVKALRKAVAAEEARSGWLPTLWFETTVEDPGQGATAAALAEAPALILVAGGDGTVRAVAEKMQSSGVPLGLIPSGTGNLLARNLAMPLNDITASVRTAFTGADRPIDVAVAEFEREDRSRETNAFMVMAGIGVDANMAANTNSALKKRIGWLAYTDPIARSVVKNQQTHMSYEIDDGRPRSIRAHTVIVGNCGTLTANILLLPDAEIDDGLLDVVMLRPKGAGGWLRVATRLVLNRFTHRTKAGRLTLRFTPNLDALQYRRATRLVVRFPDPQEIELDGDSFGSVVAARVTVRHGALLVRVPQ
jgi:diacylglycerol kinase family enzyme